MSERAGKRNQAWDVPPSWLIVAVGSAVCFSFAGWMVGLWGQGYGFWVWEEALFRTFSVFTLSESYARPVANGGVDNGYAVLLLTVARWFGIAVFILTIAKVVIELFLEGILAWKCRIWASDHIVVIGDRDFAHAIAETAAQEGIEVVHFFPDGKETSNNGILTLDSNRPLEDLLAQSAAHRARSLVFAFRDNAESIDKARSVFRSTEFRKRAHDHANISREARAIHEGPHIYVCVDDGWFEYRESLDHGFDPQDVGGETVTQGKLDSVVELLSESRCAARAVLAAHPIYAMGEDHLQHVLLVGFGAMGQALLTEICETQRTDPYRRQKISIIDPNPADWERFQRRCPEWSEVFDGRFYQTRLDLYDGSLDRFVAELDAAPLTAAYVATGAAIDPAIAAAQLKDFIDWHVEAGRLDRDFVRFPVFTCVRGETTSLETGKTEKASGAVAIRSFGAWDDIVYAARVLEAEPDRAAWRVHSVHNSIWSDKPAKNWSQEVETNRYSSRSAAAFVPTLLHAAGFDLKPWIDHAAPEPPSPNRLPTLGEGRSLAEDPTERVMLARLEHIRWCAERRLRGWRYAPRRDNATKRHPDLVDFDQLPMKSKKYNLDYIRTLSETLASEGGEPRLPGRPGAPRALVRPTDLELLRAAGFLPEYATRTENEAEHAGI